MMGRVFPAPSKTVTAPGDETSFPVISTTTRVAVDSTKKLTVWASEQS
ncbi:unnamed protein product [Haemonchus placei]|uniref:Uncharacterized protein n=1 Tax=Haemonchus placei TaxID=6290 RepID=A0A3P7UHP5_HAEPC|nr:unnamed protein product [Haemonchus placei]